MKQSADAILHLTHSQVCAGDVTGAERSLRELLTIFGPSSGGNAVPLSVLEKLVLISRLSLCQAL
jgi:hypothetical protein